MTGITYPDHSTVGFAYDTRGRRTSVTDQNGKTTSYTYDDADRLTAVTDPAGNMTQYAYDTEDNLISITDANGHSRVPHLSRFSKGGLRRSRDDSVPVSCALEKNVSGTYTQLVYGPGGGKFAVMSGQTLQQAFIPLPTGAKAVYKSYGLAYYRHHDHLGSSRLATSPSRTMCSSTAYFPFHGCRR